MRNLKRALSLALASVMLVGMMVVGTSAASYPDVDNGYNVEAIEVLNAVGVMIGDTNGNFNPDNNVTRNEMAAVMARLMLGAEAEEYVGVSPFIDVPNWAQKYVAACYDAGIVNGRSASIYDGGSTVTAQEAATMMLRALGYENITAKGSDWARPAVAKANEIRLFKGVPGNVTAPLNRNSVAQLALNTLKSTMVTTEGGASINLGELGSIDYATKYTERDSDGDNYNEIDGDDGKLQLCEYLYEGKLVLTTTTDGVGRPASAWEYDDEEVITIADKADYTVVLDGTPDDMDDLLDMAKEGLEATDRVTLKVNGATGSVEYLGAGDVAEMYLGTGSDSKKVAEIYVTRYVLDQIDEVEDDDGDVTVSFSVYGDYDAEDVSGFNARTYVKDAYVALLVNSDEEIVDSYIPKTVEGTVKTVKVSDEEITVGGGKYYSAYALTDGVCASVTVASVNPGSDYTLYLDGEGYILGIVEIEDAGEATDINDVYYLDLVWTETATSMGKDSSSYYAQLVSLDGTKTVIQLEDGDHDLPSASLKDYTNFSALNGKLLVTISDKKVEKTSKANDDKYNLHVWSEDDDWDIFGVTTGAVTLKKSDRYVTIGGKNYRLNNSTVYLFAEESGSDLAVYRYVGGVAYTGEAADRAFVITEDGSTLAKYVVIGTEYVELDESNFSSDLIFIESASSTKGDGYRSQTVYLPNGKAETWEIAEEMYDETLFGFYAYEKNDDGYYELEEADAMKVVADWQDENPEGVLNGVTFVELFEDMLTVASGDDEIRDIDVGGAAFKDLHDTDDGYGKAINSLSALSSLIKDKKVSSATLYMSVTEDGAVTIFLFEAE